MPGRRCAFAGGLYQLPDTQIEAAHMLAEAAVLVPKGVVCLTSALQYHELTLQMPSAVWMAIERTAWRLKIDYPRIRFVRFTRLALIEGVERRRVESVEVPMTDPGGGAASHREPVAIFTGEVLPQFVGDLDDGTVRTLLDELAEDMGRTLEQEEAHIAFGGQTWTLTAEPPGP